MVKTERKTNYRLLKAQATTIDSLHLQVSLLQEELKQGKESC